VECISRSVGLSIGPVDWSWVFALASLILLAPFSVGGIGLREGALVGLLGAIAIGRADALACSLILTSITALGALIGGIIELQRAWRR
jgi:hypothetical protein